MNKNKNVILGVTGSIAAFRSADIVRGLVRQGVRVEVIMTKEAQYFITPLTLQTLSCRKVYSGTMFEPAFDWDMEHIALAGRADLILIAPATANVIGRLAHGICDDLLTCVVMASRAPVLMAPAMNDGMFTHKIVEANIAGLKKIGYKFIGPVKGELACGKTAIGRMSEAQDIVQEAMKIVNRRTG